MKYLAFLLIFIASLANAQSPQSQTDPIYAVNAKYVNGIAPGYAPTAGRALNLNLSSGTVICSTTLQQYTGGVVVLSANATNYVYLDTTNSCAPTASTSVFVLTTQIPLAIVTTTSVITNINDTRTQFGTGLGGSGSGTVANQANGVIPLGTSPTAIAAQSHLDDGITTANTITSTRAFVAPVIGGSAYAKQYNVLTGISACAAAGQPLCIADPTYATTEQYTYTNMIPSVPSMFHFEDEREGMTQNFYHNWPYPRLATFSGVPAANVTNCLMDAPYTLSATSLYDCSQVMFNDSEPGLSVGNPPVPLIGNTAWQVGAGLNVTYTSLGAGIREALNTVMQHNGIGDTAWYAYINSHGGSRATSDEGTEFATAVTEDVSQFRESCVGGCTNGSQAISGTPTSFSGSQGVRCCIIDITQGATANTITNLAAGLSATLEAVTFGTAVTASNFWGTLAAPVQPNGADVGHSPYGTVLTFNVNLVGGTAPTITTLMCFASQFHDVITPTSVTGSGPYAVTALVRKPHASGSVIMQGSLCGSGMEIVANTPAGANPNRYLVDVIGCISTTVCEVTFFRQGSGSPGPFVTGGGNFNSTIYLSGAVTGLTSNGTTVYATGVTGFPVGYNKTNVIFSGASDSALNGTVCTAVTFISNSQNNFSCTLAVLTGQHTATTATYVLATTTAALNVINIWPMAEVLDVQTYNSTTCTALNLAPVCVRGDLALEPNNIAFATSDTITELNDEAGQYTGFKSNLTAQNPYSIFHSLFLGVGGNGAQGGSGGLTGNPYITIGAGGGDNLYTDNGGSVTPLNTIQQFGAYYDWAILQEAPSNGRSLFNLSTVTTNQKTNPNYFYNLINSLNNSGSFSTIAFLPFLGDMNLTASGQLGLGGTGGNIHFNSNSDAITFNDRILFSPITPPTCTVTQGPGAGTLPDGTYYYRIASRNDASGAPGIPGTECSGAVANGGANSVKVTWTRAPGTTIYYPYGRTIGAELGMGNVGGNLVLIDNGSITPSGAIPTTDLTRGFVDQAAKIGLNSPTTLFEMSLTAPTGVSGNYIELGPATGTAGQLIDIANSTTTVVNDCATFANTTGRIKDGGACATAYLTGTTGTITGTSLTATCDSGTATVTGAAVGSPVTVSSTTGADVGGAFDLRASVTSTNTVTVYVCGTGTPASLAYNVRVLP
jgi:hypothetical protein